MQQKLLIPKLHPLSPGIFKRKLLKFMLHTETVNTETLALIKKLQNDSVLKEFMLVGGTALSLQIGYRI